MRQVVQPGANVLIYCSASGDQPVTLRWAKQDAPLPRSVAVRDGELNVSTALPSHSPTATAHRIPPASRMSSCRPFPSPRLVPAALSETLVISNSHCRYSRCLA